jgi:hypothetical protein
MVQGGDATLVTSITTLDIDNDIDNISNISETVLQQNLIIFQSSQTIEQVDTDMENCIGYRPEDVISTYKGIFCRKR